MVFFGGAVISSGGVFLIVEIANEYFGASAVYLGVPFAGMLRPRDSLVLRAVIALLLSLVPAILKICDDSKIGLAIVQAVMVDVVDEFAGRNV